MTSSQTPTLVYVTESALDAEANRYLTGAALGARPAKDTVAAAQVEGEVLVDRLRSVGAYVEGLGWQETDGAEGVVATRTVAFRPDPSHPDPLPPVGGLTGTVTQRVLARPTTGTTDGSLTALDFVQRYLDSVSGGLLGGHMAESTACTYPNPRGKTADYTCSVCEAQRILDEAVQGQ